MMKCSAKAFAACPTRHLCGSIEDATYCEGSECDKFNQEIENHVFTNADQIRAMGDEELGRFLASVETRRSAAGGGAIWKGAAHAIRWLKEPAEEVQS